MRRSIFLLTLLVIAAISASAQEGFDQYGGALSSPCPSGPKPHAYFEKIVGNDGLGRWWWCTPDGNAFWWLSHWLVTASNSAATAKRGGPMEDATLRTGASSGWYSWMSRRFHKWGITALDGYSAEQFSPPMKATNIEPLDDMPMMFFPKPSYSGSFNENGSLIQPLKQADTSLSWSFNYAGRTAAWRLQDLFDRAYPGYFTSMLKAVNFGSAFTSDASRTKWVFGYGTDDTDWVMGFAQGKYHGYRNGVVDGNGSRQPHDGTLFLYVAPSMGVHTRTSPAVMLGADPRTATSTCTTASEVGAKGVSLGYSNAITTPFAIASDGICTKYALSKFLEKKYGTIAALNSAWGTGGYYTSFGTTGTAIRNRQIGTTNGTTVNYDLSIPLLPGQAIEPWSIRLYLNGKYVAADARHRMSDVIRGCTNQIYGPLTRGFLFGPTLSEATRVGVRCDPWKVSSIDVSTDGIGTITIPNQVVNGYANTGTSAAAGALVGDYVRITDPSTTLNGLWKVISKLGATVTVDMTGVTAGSYTTANMYVETNAPSLVDYSAGTLTLRFPTPPASGQTIVVDYRVNGWSSGGRGILDEDGLRGNAAACWLPDTKTSIPNVLESTIVGPSGPGCITQSFVDDMNEFLYRYAYRYFKDMRDAIDAETPGCDRSQKGTCLIYSGTSYLNGWSSPTFGEIIQAASDVLDVLPASNFPTPFIPDALTRLDYVDQHWGDKPIFSWEAQNGGPDSEFGKESWNDISPPWSMFQSQEMKGDFYQKVVRDMLTYTSRYGSHPYVGAREWGYTATPGEGLDYGPVTSNSDPLDGFCPGKGTRREYIPGQTRLETLVVQDIDGKRIGVATPKFRLYHNVRDGSRVRIAGCKGVDQGLCNKEWVVTGNTASTFTMALDSTVAVRTYGDYITETTLRVAEQWNACGGQNAPVANSAYASGDSRKLTDLDGVPFNNRFGDFLTAYMKANRYWWEYLPKRPVSSGLGGDAAVVDEDAQPYVTAKSLVVMDAATGDVLFSKEPERPRTRIASTTKLMTSLVIKECDPNLLATNIQVSSYAASVGGTRAGVPAKSLWSAPELMYGLMLPSGNDAANALAEYYGSSIGTNEYGRDATSTCGLGGDASILGEGDGSGFQAFVAQMNLRAEQLGMTGTHFVIPHGLEPTGSEHYSTALDMAKLMRYIWQTSDRPTPIFSSTDILSFMNTTSHSGHALSGGNNQGYNWNNTARIEGMYPGAVAAKTGSSPLADLCLTAYYQRNGKTLIGVILGAGSDANGAATGYMRQFELISAFEYAAKKIGANVGTVTGRMSDEWGLEWSSGWTPNTIANSTYYIDAYGRSSNVAGATGTIKWWGTGIDIIAPKAPTYGIATYSLDGGAPEDVDYYAATVAKGATVKSYTGLADQWHTLVIKVTGDRKNGSSSGYYIPFDEYTTTRE